MSRKFLELHSSTGISNKKVTSKFGMKMLSKMGWEDGEGLGKHKSGITECIQIRKREINIGLGAEVVKTSWNDMWWQNSYDKILNNVNIEMEDKPQINLNDDSGESSASTSSDDESIKQIKIKKVDKKKTKVDIEETFINKKRKIKVFEF